MSDLTNKKEKSVKLLRLNYIMTTDPQLSLWKKLRNTVVWEYTQVIVVALILVFGFIRPFVVEAFKIPSGSMEDTLLIGDRILVCKFIYGFKIPGTQIKVFDFHKPERGDVFVFIPRHEEEKNYIKRIVAVEGDTVHTDGKTLYVNGNAVKDSLFTKHVKNPYVRKKDFPPFQKPDKFMQNSKIYEDFILTDTQFKRKFPEGKPFTVPTAHVFAMGDNRNLSLDSRSWGPVPIDRIKGQAFMVYWSAAVEPANDYQDARIWEVGKHIQNIRFKRIGKIIASHDGLEK